MKILLVCAGGVSTGILMRKMETYWRQQNVELTIDAVGVAEYIDVYEDYDIILVGPQIGYREKKIKDETKLPCAVINTTDYALGNCANIMQLALKLYEERN